MNNLGPGALMDQETRTELEKLHGRINEVKNRVTILETTVPHISASLIRIERSVDKLGGYLSRAVWIILALFVTAVWKLIASGSIPGV